MYSNSSTRIVHRAIDTDISVKKAVFLFSQTDVSYGFNDWMYLAEEFLHGFKTTGKIQDPVNNEVTNTDLFIHWSKLNVIDNAFTSSRRLYMRSFDVQFSC